MAGLSSVFSIMARAAADQCTCQPAEVIRDVNNRIIGYKPYPVCDFCASQECTCTDPLYPGNNPDCPNPAHRN